MSLRGRSSVAGRRRKRHDRQVRSEELDPMAYPELLDALAAWAHRQRPRLEQQRWTVVAKDKRTYDKWCGTVEIEGPQRIGYSRCGVRANWTHSCSAQLTSTFSMSIASSAPRKSSSKRSRRSWRSWGTSTHGSRCCSEAEAAAIAGAA